MVSTEPIPNQNTNEMRVLMGSEAAGLPDDTKLAIGRMVNYELDKHCDTMLPHAAEEVAAMFDDMRAVAVTNTDATDVYGFARLLPWPEGSEETEVTEFGSWISKRAGAGYLALQNCVALNRVRFPGLSVYALVENGNEYAKNYFTKVGGILVPKPDAIRIKLTAGDQAAAVTVFNLTNIPTELV